MTRVKNIIKSDPEISLTSTEAIVIIAKVLLVVLSIVSLPCLSGNLLHTIALIMLNNFLDNFCRQRSCLLVIWQERDTSTLSKEKEKLFKRETLMHVYQVETN